MAKLAGKPSELGYRWPAEWEPHVGTLLSWAHNRESWPDKFKPIPFVYQRLVETLSQFEPVHIQAAGDALEEAQRMVGHLPNVTLHPIATNDAWARDHGPIFLQSTAGEQPRAALDWRYNAWGGKYPPWDADDASAQLLLADLDIPYFEPGIILEGGAVEGNGAGVILTTEECLLNPNRNPTLSRDDMERYLRDYLCAEKVLWLGRGIVGDDTDGHIDELARFVAPNRIVAAYEPNPGDENHEPLAENFARLQAMTDQHGKPFEVIKLPMPQPKLVGEQRIPACYCNFYIANGVVIVPQFDDPADAGAVEVLRRCFPEREIVPLPALDLVWGLGAYHCITQQIMA
ncbi:agmatine deiminase family protein [Blastopirellula sp. J2-11]|uniref:agmatine deiminase family protein n=1 Tax=Blastopirellula sp. J2-11 TaxID=2943192 RepID=UPI0021C722E5|nr:agmatine deiminase family protein [Blastopirellula sp. J2-11]UUO06915.1 agmatine deiminase family protein [Blastopirellula sp. J2-11]